MFKKQKEDMMSCLRAVDMKLVDDRYLCGPKLTLGDIIIFNEVSRFFELTGLHTEHAEVKDLPNITKWFKVQMLGNINV